MITSPPIRENVKSETFNEFFIKNRFLIIGLIGVTAIVWFIFKLAYPFPDFFSDSYSYIEAASSKRNINIWPIGYSKFLLIFHQISTSSNALVTFQYVSLELCCIYFYLTINYLVHPNQIINLFLFLFLFTNPFQLYVSNYVSSDSIFCSLTLIWITELLWLFYAPSPYRIIPITLCSFFAFTIRYNALYYPFITSLALIVSREKKWIKILGSVAIAPFLFIFYIYSTDAGESLTGKPIWSILSGWQWANNALYMRGFINVDTQKLPNKDCQELDHIADDFFKENRPIIEYILSSNQGNFFIQSPYSPLKVYMFQKFPPAGVRDWGLVSPLYNKYGLYLIVTHPIAYFKYYIWLNVGNYFLPPLEKFNIYNLGENYIWPTGVRWFELKSKQAYCINSTLQGKIMKWYSYYFCLLNYIFLFLLIYGSSNTSFWKDNRKNRNLLIICWAFWLVNFGFSVFANIIVLRYQLFPMIFLTACSLILAQKLCLDKTPPKTLEV